MADVTFGKTTNGATRLLVHASLVYIQGTVFTSGANSGTLNKISAWVGRDVYGGAGSAVKAAVYDIAGNLIAASATEYTGPDLPETPASIDFLFSGEAIAASTDYALVLMMDHYGTINDYALFRRDNTGGVSKGSTAYPYGDFPDPITWATDSTRLYSIAATYTEGGGGASAVPVIMRSYRQRLT